MIVQKYEDCVEGVLKLDNRNLGKFESVTLTQL